MPNDEDTSLDNKLGNYLKTKYNKPDIDFSEPLIRFRYGQTTFTYRFQLVNAPPELSKPLVLRLFRDTKQGSSTGYATKEGTLQNILYKNNYPSPRAHIMCEDMKQLGGEFMVMDFMRGESMWESVPINKIPELLAEAQVKLHKIDPASIIEGLKSSSIPREWYDGTVYIDTWITSNNMSWLKPGLKWVYDNEPSERSSAVVHCDFHPNNILVDDGEISAVLDWTSGRIGEPEKDVASTRNVLRAFRPFFRPDVDWVSFTDDYLASYLRRSRVDLERVDMGKVEFYEALHSLRVLELVEAGFTRDLPGVRDRLLVRFREVTGLSLSK